MPLVFDSSPDCVTHNEGAKPPDDIADFILQANYQDCAGFMTFGPGSTYGEDGTGAETIYYVITWLGIVVSLLVLLAWVVYENRQFVHHMARRGTTGPEPGSPPQPGTHHEGI